MTEMGLKPVKEDNTTHRTAWMNKMNSLQRPHVMGDIIVYFILCFHLGFSMSTLRFLRKNVLSYPFYQSRAYRPRVSSVILLHDRHHIRQRGWASRLQVQLLGHRERRGWEQGVLYCIYSECSQTPDGFRFRCGYSMQTARCREKIEW